ncbi:MAG: hypothetical protein GY829_09840 [Gammaproteobacteria bacterium]|nr:hypothetical protein [Gammaproteobacteria bacterium]
MSTTPSFLNQTLQAISEELFLTAFNNNGELGSGTERHAAKLGKRNYE